MSFSIILLLALLTAVVVMLILARIFYRRGRFQFSLRTLFLVIALVAILLSAGTSWRYLHMAKTEWLALSSPDAQQLSAEPVVSETDEGYVVTYRSKRRDVLELRRLAREKRALFPKRPQRSHTDGVLQEIHLQSNDRTALEAWLSVYEEADVLPAGQFAIRGLVEDRQGRPVSGAKVDLMGPGPYVHIQFRTRSDGTFTMLIKPPPGRGYFLQIRYGDGHVNVKRTQSFSLSPDRPERVVKIRL